MQNLVLKNAIESLQLAIKAKKGINLLVATGANYKVLKKNEEVEIRLYNPSKHTVAVSGHRYFLQFPHTLFKRHLWHGYSRWDVTNSRHVSLYAGLTDPEVKNVFAFPFGGIFQYSACLDATYHYDWPPNTTIEELMNVFWATEFVSIFGYPDQPFNGRYHNWAKMDLAQVQKEVSKLSMITYEKFEAHRRY